MAALATTEKPGERIFHNVLFRNRGRPRLFHQLLSLLKDSLLNNGRVSSWLSDYRLEWSDKFPAEEQALIDLKYKSLKKANNELETLRKQLDRTHDLLEQGVYDTDTFLARSRSLNEKIAAAEAGIEALTAEVYEDEKRAASRRSIVPKVEKLLEVYAELPSAQAKNEMLFFNRLNCFSASSAKILGVESCPLRPSESQVAAQIK